MTGFRHGGATELGDAGEEGGNAGGIGDIAGHGDELLARSERRGQLGASALDVGGGAGAEDDVGAGGEEGLHDVAAKSLAAAGDEGVASGKFHAGRPTVR